MRVQDQGKNAVGKLRGGNIEMDFVFWRAGKRVTEFCMRQSQGPEMHLS